MAVLLDTCILSPFFSKKGPRKELINWMLDQDALAISVVTQFEIEMGLRSANLRKVASFFPALVSEYEISILEMTPKQVELAAFQGAIMKKSGRIFSLQDLWIGAVAVSLKLDLATANFKDFNHWQDLKILNPLKQTAT